MASKITKNLTPSDFVAETLQRSERDFEASFGDVQFLLIKLDDRSGELAAGLSATTTGGGTAAKPSLDVMGYHTVVHSEVGGLGSAGASSKGVDATAIRRRLVEAPHFIVPLRKRDSAGSAYQQRISVGRARNKDVVLRHRSVSKFHGWFERDDAGTFYVSDAGSKNGVKVDGEEVPARKLQRVEPGMLIMFGTVEATLVPPGVLWQLIHE